MFAIVCGLLYVVCCSLCLCDGCLLFVGGGWLRVGRRLLCVVCCLLVGTRCLVWCCLLCVVRCSLVVGGWLLASCVLLVACCL